MYQAFFSHPLWQKFQTAPITVFGLSDGEHRLRDAYAHILLKEFLPADTRFETFAVNGGRSPSIAGNPKGGIVILGRPAFFPSRIRSLLADAQPPLLYRFASDDKAMSSAFRSILRSHEATSTKAKPLPKFAEGKSFEQQRKAKSNMLKDHAIVYSGWYQERPLMLLAGTSTVGTWGVTQFVTKTASPSIPSMWQQDIQGVVEAEVGASIEAFDEVQAEIVEILGPARFWLEGGDRPPSGGWTRADLPLEGNRPFDLRIIVNGQPILKKSRSCWYALALMTWLSKRTPYPDGFVAETNSGEILSTLYRFLRIDGRNSLNLGSDGGSVQSEKDFTDSKIGKQMCQRLKDLTVAIRENGGIAYVDDASEPWTFRLVSRELPHFFPMIR